MLVETVIDPHFLIRFFINVETLFILIRLTYYRKTPNHDFLFAFFLFGIGVFLVTYLLHTVELSMGFAFGLFAIFSMLRYRTESISIKEMTYLFLVIIVSLLSAIGPVAILDLLILNTAICVGALFAEANLFSPLIAEKTVEYEKIDNIKPENRELLIQDLQERTGLNIKEVTIGRIDFLRDSATIKIQFYPEK